MNRHDAKPLIRISPYTDSWEKSDFESEFDYVSNNSLSRSELTNQPRSTQNIHYGDVLVKYGEVLDVSEVVLPYIENEEVASKLTSAYLRNGDVIIADAAEDNTVGKCCELIGIEKEKIVSGLHTIPCRPKKKYGMGYLGYYMNSRAYHDQLLPLIQGTKISSISKTAIQSTNVVRPKDKSEQEEIGKFFLNLDAMIERHVSEHLRLICLRKAMMDKMFPQNGSNVPAVRFKQFTEPWINKPFSEIFVERHTIDTVSEEYPQLSFTIEEGVIRPEDRKTNKRDFLILDKANKKYLQTEYDDIIYNPANVIYGAIHRNGLGKGCVSPIYKIFYTEQDSTFMECIVRHPRFINAISRSMEGTVKKLKTLKPEAFLKMSAYIAPTIDEQKMIGQYFAQMDRLIEIEKEEIEKIQHIKSACLEKMFV